MRWRKFQERKYRKYCGDEEQKYYNLKQNSNLGKKYE